MDDKTNVINAPTIEPDSDTISRQAAINEIEERKNANGYRNVAIISELNRLEGYIMRLPSAQPQRKKGKWEMVSQLGNPPTYVYRCSECHHKVFGLSNFCPNCGADMQS